jgi:hypothetical protein
MLGHEWAVCDRGVWFKSCKHLVIWGRGNPEIREICYFATLNFGCLLLCHPVSMTGGTVCVYDLWVRWHTGEAHK